MKAVKKIGGEIKVLVKLSNLNTNQKRQAILAGLGILLLVVGVVVPFPQFVKAGVLVFAYLVVGYDVLVAAGKNIRAGHWFDENFLMAIATIGALAIGEFAEAVAVMLFYKIGDFFQDLAVENSKRSISSLLQLRPDYANLVLAHGKINQVSPSAVEIGDVIQVKPGEKVPLDGKIIEGSSYLDTAALTGESNPVFVSPGQTILSGTVNQSGVLQLKVTKRYGDSTVAKILKLVESASEKKTKVENFITRFSRFYTPAVVGLAALVAILPPLLTGGAWLTWLYRALSVLVISCPCALVISVPLSYFSGIGAASKQGVLVKGSNYLDVLNQVKIMVFDKTGTLTVGHFTVSQLHPVGISSAELLKLAAVAERKSPHPIAKALVQASNTREEAKKITEVVGQGVKAQYQGKVLLVGNAKLMHSQAVKAFVPLTGVTGTVVYVAWDGQFKGAILVADTVKSSAKEALGGLKQSGITQTIMLTGDNEATAKAVATELGVDQVYANLLPEDKLKLVRRFQKTNQGKVAFVGDGLNDTPVLAGSDLGIAMGALGSDAAIEAADIVLMNDEPSSILVVRKLAQKTRQIAQENIAFAIAIKVGCLALAAFGIVNLWEAVFADVGVTLIAVLNALRLVRTKAIPQKQQPTHPHPQVTVEKV